MFPYNPLGGGLLAGAYGRARRPERGRLIANAMYRERYGDQANFDVAERFVALASELGHHPEALAVAWVASHPAVTAPLLGARTLELNMEETSPDFDVSRTGPASEIVPAWVEEMLAQEP